MSRRRTIVRRIGSLRDLQDIVTVMKHLAMIEIAKLSRTYDARKELIASLGAELERFVTAHPAYARARVTLNVDIVIGSERGFCGDFNDRVAAELLHTTSGGDAYVIGIGTHLVDRLAPGTFAVTIPGASTMDEIEEVLLRLLRELETAQRHMPRGLVCVRALSQTGDGVAVLPITPPTEASGTASTRAAVAADLQLAPSVVFDGLFQAYMDAALSEVLSASLMAENRARLERMDSASRHIDERVAQLTRSSQRLRQEEITQEIEVIELSIEVATPKRRFSGSHDNEDIKSQKVIASGI